MSVYLELALGHFIDAGVEDFLVLLHDGKKIIATIELDASDV